MAKTEAKTRMIFIGGVNKDGIGGNCSVIEHTASDGTVDRAMFDLGCKFTPWESGFVAAYPNVDEYFDRTDPKTGKTFKASKPVSALFITHAHEDHIGGLINYVKMGYNLPPIYAGNFARQFIRQAFYAEGLKVPEIQKVKEGDNIKVGENMIVEPVVVSHSIVDALGFHTLTFDKDKPFSAIMNNGDFLTEEEMPVGQAFSKNAYLDVFKRKKAKQTLIGIDSTSTTPNGKERIGFDTAVENTLSVIQKNPDRSVIVSPVITRSIQNIAIDVEVARKLGTKICLDGKWLQIAKKAMMLSGYKDFDDVIYKGDMKSYMSDKKIGKKYIVCTGAFAQGLDDYERNRGVTPNSPIPMASATRMALDLHPDFHIDRNCLVISRQRIIDEINGKSGPKMLNYFAAQGAKVVMTPGAKPVSNFEQVQMQDSGHANARAVRDLMRDVKDVVPSVAVVPIHGDPQQCEYTKEAMDTLDIPSHIVANHQALELTAKKIEAKEDLQAPRTWIALKLVYPSPQDEDKIVPAVGLSEYYEVDENYMPVSEKPICTVSNVWSNKPKENEKGYNKFQKKIKDADNQPTHGKMFRRKQSVKFPKKGRDGR